MADKHFDVIVVGLGIMGASTLYQLAKRGANVLGIDRFSPPHTNGSSHGDTRITRQAIGEGEMYMPFIRRSNEIWRELEAETGQQLYLKTGGLIIAPKVGGAQFHAYEGFAQRSAQIAQKYQIEHEMLSAEDVQRRYPNLILRSQDEAYYEPDAGVLRPELCIQVQLDMAERHHARIHTNEKVLSYTAQPDGVTVTTDKGTYHADKIVLSVGAWLLDLLEEAYRPNVEVYRQVIYWFEADDLEAYNQDHFPFLIWIGDRMEDFFSVFPVPHDGIPGVKVLTEQYMETTHPDEIDREIKPEEIHHIYHALTKSRLKGVQETLVDAGVCMYTVTPDEHFILDYHPESERVIIASPCSGHGFKHAAAIGETLAEMAITGKTTINIDSFSLKRLSEQ